MRKDIILSGVGGQGILTIATIIGEAATAEGINLKQAEVHGMSQRGGDVQSNLRLSDETIYSDLIAQGEADLIISMEPMEALRYLPYLQEEGWVITSANPFKNIPDYPEEVDLMRTLESLPHMVKLEIEDMASSPSLKNKTFCQIYISITIQPNKLPMTSLAWKKTQKVIFG